MVVSRPERIFQISGLGVTLTLASSNASQSLSTWSWDCDSLRWQRLWASTAAALGLAHHDESVLATLRWTQRQEELWCPVAVAASRLAHCILTFRRDWHGDILKLKARPIHMLQIPMQQDLQLILQPQVLLPKDSKGLQWHLLLFDAMAKLSSLLCPVGEESGIALDYDFYCQQRPWAFGCAEGLPSCNRTAKWRKSPRELRQCGERGACSELLEVTYASINISVKHCKATICIHLHSTPTRMGTISLYIATDPTISNVQVGGNSSNPP